MDLQKSQIAIRRGAYAGFVVAGVTTVMVGIAMWMNATGWLALWNDPWNLIDIVLILGLSIGVWRKSRLAAVSLVIYFILSQIIVRLEIQHLGGLLVSLAILYFLVKAAIGTFVYHRLRRQQDPEYRGAKRWMYIVAIPGVLLGILFVTLVIIGLIGPPTAVVDGEEIGPRDRRMLRSEGVLEPGEDIVLFYSAGIFSIREDGNMVTDRRVISYWLEDDEIWMVSAVFGEIADATMEVEGGTFEDSVIAITETDGEEFKLLASTEKDGHKRMLDEILERVADNGK